MAKPLRSVLRTIGLGLACLVFAAPPAPGADFYEGKTVRITVAFAAGGGFDLDARTMARHLGRHIPGHPTVIVENMPGAGGLVAANHLFKLAKPDGLTLALLSGSAVTGQLLGGRGVEFDARNFEWVGVPTVDKPVCALTKASGITSVERWMASKAPVKLGGTGLGATTHDIPLILRAALGLPIHPVPGYRGTAEIRLAAEGGEVAGGCWSWHSLKATWGARIDSGDVVPVLQTTPRPHPDVPQIPLAIDLAKTEEARQLIKAGIHDPNAVHRVYSLPPGTPRERVEILRKAFLDTMEDPTFLAEAKKAKLDPDPLSGEEVERIVAGLFKMDPALIAKLKEVLTPR